MRNSIRSMLDFISRTVVSPLESTLLSDKKNVILSNHSYGLLFVGKSIRSQKHRNSKRFKSLSSRSNRRKSMRKTHAF